MRKLICIVLVLFFSFGCQTTRTIHLTLDLPEGYKLLPSAEPSFTLYNNEGELLQTFPIEKTKHVFTLQNSGHYVKGIAKVYYCPDQEEGLCIIHEATFDIVRPKKNIHLYYTLPEDF